MRNFKQKNDHFESIFTKIRWLAVWGEVGMAQLVQNNVSKKEDAIERILLSMAGN